MGWFAGVLSHMLRPIHIQDWQLSGGQNPTADYGYQVPAQAASEVMQPKIPGITDHLRPICGHSKGDFQKPMRPSIPKGQLFGG